MIHQKHTRRLYDKTKFLVPLFCTGLATIATSACQRISSQFGQKKETPAEVFRVGLVGPLTGLHADYGTSLKQGLDLALHKYHQGKPEKLIRLIPMDDQSSTEHARAATERMILKDKIHVLVAGMTSASALVIAPLAVRAQIPMLTPSATHPAVTEFGELIFRTCFIDETQAQIMARHAVKKQGYSRVAILKDVQSSYSMQLAESFARSAQELGATLVGTEIYSSGDDDFEIPLTALKALKPEAIYIPGYHRDIGRILATALELGVDAVFLGADGWAAPSLWLDRKSTVPVSFFTSHFHVDEPLAKVQDFVAAYKMRFNEAPDAFAALGYDVAQIVIKAIKAVPRANAQALGAQLLRAAPHRGVTGTIDLRDATQKSAVIVEVDAGGLRFHERASLSTE